MIIDITREMDDEEYKKYLDLVQRYDEKYWLIDQDNRDLSGDWDEIAAYKIPDDVWNMTTPDEEYYLNGLSVRVHKCIDHFKKRGWIVIEHLINFHMILWLERRGSGYAIIYDAIEFDYFWLAIKNKDEYKFFNAKWGIYIDEEFLYGKGWIKQFIKNHHTIEIKWCEDNLDDDFILGRNCFYVTKEAFMAYKLRWM